MNQEDSELELFIQTQIEQQLEDQKLYREWKANKEERRELEPLECEHEFETVDRLDKDTVLQVCLVCDFERTVLKPK